MKFERIMIANRGEIAIRIARSVAELGIRSVGIHSQDDRESLHASYADESYELPGTGPAAYLDIDAVIAAAVDMRCDAVHPGYGFLSERASFARACQDRGVRFIGPRPDALTLFGDKAASRELAVAQSVPVLSGTESGITSKQASEFLSSLPEDSAMILKASSGGGGRGQRIVRIAEDVDEAFARCESEALAFFGDGRLFAEQYLTGARHIEVQVLGDSAGNVSYFYDRDCSIQRRFQKIIEVAPAPRLAGEVRSAIADAAVRMASCASYEGLGTFEFLVSDEGFYFMEANPRLQVEHTVTEEVLGVDLVRAQIEVASGSSLASLGLGQRDIPSPRGFAVQARINTERIAPDGSPIPTSGVIQAFDLPAGSGVRTDSFGYTGYRTSHRYDPLLAKVIVHSRTDRIEDAYAKAARSLDEARIRGVATNVNFLAAVLRHPTVAKGTPSTRFVDDNADEILSRMPRPDVETPGPDGVESGLAGSRVDTNDPLSVLNARDRGPERRQTREAAYDESLTRVVSPMQGTIVEVAVQAGDLVAAGRPVAVMEAMKMEHPINATVGGMIHDVVAVPGDAVLEGHTLVTIEPQDVDESVDVSDAELDPDHVRPDLQELLDYHAAGRDESRPAAVAKRHRKGYRTARENIDDLCDTGTFVEHGSLVLTSGTGLPEEEVVRDFSGDSMVCGIGDVNGADFGPGGSRTAVLSYDYMVLAGTQSQLNHLKTDRILQLAADWELPVVFFAEGGGGRAGTGGRRAGGGEAAPSNNANPRSLAVQSFAAMGRLSGRVPTIGITNGYCFAGNAALLGMCDVVIATEDSNIGMGGPALIEGGGLGVFAPEEIGPIEVQSTNGVVDIVVRDEAEAVRTAKQYLSYFQGPVDDWVGSDQQVLRHVIPENRLRTYSVRDVITGIADDGSVLELRRDYGRGMVTSLARIEGKPVGILANNPEHMAGAIDSEGALKAARFMQQLESFGIPLVVLCDTPGIMVGPESEKTGAVRHCNTLFTVGAQLTIPLFMVILRKAVGLGAIAMAGGSITEPAMAVAWPTGEFAGMGIEGQVKLGYRKELEAIEDTNQRMERYRQLVDEAYERSKAVRQAASFHVDDVIDPSDTRRILADVLRSVGARGRRNAEGHR
ncbi:carboxyl transferase domain-containing protein [Cumulibacter soli]|uniref:carboxyl transferase domain-containing protein n=1 Tax=Cumulibacter soli TaxID=2546344 RepID=UPI0010675F97|nr:carboxyl transferase domain-containing protein [Cumulibacter soli]